MKKYILLSYSITGMGGGQMYQRNKIKFMKENGYDSYVLYTIPGAIVIPDFHEYEKNCIKNLGVNPSALTKRKIEKTLQTIEKLIGEIDKECVIECNNKVASVWGEIIAKKYGCRSIVIILDEKIGSLDQGMKNLLEFKYKRKELFGARNETFKMIFNKDVPSNYKYEIPFLCSNVVEDIESQFVNDIKKKDLNVCTIGRLDKGYVWKLVNEVKKCALNHTNYSFQYIMIGDSPNIEDRNRIIKLFCDIDNIELLMPGAMFPIPRKLFSKIDLFISSAASARVSAVEKVPTITVDARDYKAIGILGVSTQNTVFRTSEVAIDISTMMDEFLFGDKYKLLDIEFAGTNSSSFDRLFKEHLSRLAQMNPIGEYYDVGVDKLSLLRKIEKIILLLFGYDFYQSLRKVVFKRL